MATTFEPGQYVGKVTHWALVKAKNENKTPQFALTFLPLGRVDPQNPEGDLLPCPEVERTVFRPITANTAGWLLRDLQQFFEYPHESFVPLDPDGPDPFDFRDKELPTVLTYEDYEGKIRDEVEFRTRPERRGTDVPGGSPEARRALWRCQTQAHQEEGRGTIGNDRSTFDV